MSDTVSAPRPDVFGRMTGTTVTAAAFVGVAAYLGADWPREMVLGAPLGVWAVLAAAGSVGVALSRAPGRRAAWPDRVTRDWAPRLVPMGYRFVKRVALACGCSDAAIERAEEAWLRRLDRAADAPPPLVGLDLAPGLADAVARAGRDLPVQWLDLGAARGSHVPLDAVVSVHAGQYQVTTRESDGRDASWYDWSRPRPLSYSSVFPLRVDPSRITLGEGDDPAPEALAALAATAAVLSRTPVRLTLADRLAGRRAVRPTMTEAAMFFLAQAALDTRLPLAVRAPALRGVCAYLSTAERADPALRVRVARAAAEALPLEPESHLRLAAAEFAGMDDDRGFAAALAAERLIRATGPEPIQNHLAFLQSEVELGLPSPATLGRVAAGITLVCACAPPERVPYMRDDFLDDLRYSGWLVGRDQDRAVIIELFRRLGYEAPAKAAA